MTTQTTTDTNSLQARMRAEMIRYHVQTSIVCPMSGDVLDVRTCVVFDDPDGDPALLVSPSGYRIMRDERGDLLERLAAQGLTADPATVSPDRDPKSTNEPQAAPTVAWTITEEQRNEIRAQIGFGNIAAISGGRCWPLPDGIELPVSQGYRVRVRLTPADDYTVQRVMVRGDREFPKGERTGVYCDQVGQFAYRASCFHSYDENQW